ncbi:MAG TPA: alpha/beta hydrolase [Nocardioides sp.]|nr:alpha/beta hydrolase [Nocardioides sp.]
MGLSVRAMLDLLDDDARALAETVLREAPPPPYSRYGVDTVRAMFDSANPVDGSDPDLDVVDLRVPTAAGVVRVRAYRPTGGGVRPALVYLHGGGFVIGTLGGVDALCRTLARDVGCVVVSVDYRRAPESVFPAAADDCLAVYDWLERASGELGIDASRLALAGDSAGGNLALSVCTSLAAAGRAQPACLVLAYPATSARFEGSSWEVYEDAPILCRADAEWMVGLYLDGPDAACDPRAVPELSAALHVLPPMLIISAEVDPLRSDYERFAAAAAWAGSEVELSRYDGVAHGFFTEVESVAKAREAVSEASGFLCRHLAARPVATRYGG